ALVFFILTTIAFGVMWYLSFSEMDQKNKDLAAKEAEKKPLRDQAREAEQKARVYRAWLGIEIAGEDKDKATISGEAAAGDVYARELDAINAAVIKKVNPKDPEAFTKEMNLWTTDNTKKVAAPPVEGFVDQIAKLNAKDAVFAATEKERDSYAEQVKSMQKN